jgi:hypothetical protein
MNCATSQVCVAEATGADVEVGTESVGGGTAVLVAAAGGNVGVLNGVD